MTSTSGVVLMSDIGLSADPPALIAMELSYPSSGPPGPAVPDAAADGTGPSAVPHAYDLSGMPPVWPPVVVAGLAPVGPVVVAVAVCALRCCAAVGFTAPFEAR